MQSKDGGRRGGASGATGARGKAGSPPWNRASHCVPPWNRGSPENRASRMGNNIPPLKLHAIAPHQPYIPPHSPADSEEVIDAEAVDEAEQEDYREQYRITENDTIKMINAKVNRDCILHVQHKIQNKTQFNVTYKNKT